MMGVVALSLLLVPGAPVPPGASGVQAGPPSAKVDTVPLNQFASLIETLANTVRDYSAPDSVTQKELYPARSRACTRRWANRFPRR